MLYVIEIPKERCASLSKTPEDYLCEEEDPASLLKLGTPDRAAVTPSPIAAA
jgi:hypothetical protein